jgi:hypothetical protein
MQFVFSACFVFLCLRGKKNRLLRGTRGAKNHKEISPIIVVLGTPCMPLVIFYIDPAMRSALYILLIFSCSEALAQQLAVIESRNAWFPDGYPVVRGDIISLKKLVKVDNGGYLMVKYRGRSVYLKPGTHSLDSVFKKEKLKPDFVHHDSVYTVLEKENLFPCQKIKNYKLNVYEPPKNEHNITITENGTLLLKWYAWPGYNGEYYIVFSNMFDESLHVEKTASTELRVNLARFKKESHVLYRVVTKTCIGSKKMLIRLK